MASLFIYKGAAAQTSSYGELQAAYLYNFAKYIKWPAEPEEFVIGVFGDEDMMKIFQKTLKEKKVGGKGIKLKKMNKGEESLECHIVYLSESNSKELGMLKEIIRDKSILIVTEKDMIKKGASISFVVEDEQLKFKLKKSALFETGLVPSEGLLKLAIQF